MTHKNENPAADSTAAALADFADTAAHRSEIADRNARTARADAIGGSGFAKIRADDAERHATKLRRAARAAALAAFSAERADRADRLGRFGDPDFK